MIILGIDPGYAIVGIGVIEYKGNKFRPLEYNAITTNAHTMTSHRLKIIYDEINHRSIKKDRVGYLSYKDINYALKKL